MMLTVIVYLASPPARRALGRVKLVAQKNTLNRLNQWTTWVHIVELDNTVEGFVPAAQLCKGEPQVIDGVSMLDPLTGKSWMLGSSMKIQVAAADVALGRIDFEYMVE